MNDETSREFFKNLLSLSPPWEVAGVRSEGKNGEVILDLAFRPSSDATCPSCPICRTRASLYDSGKLRQWRHLDVMGRKTFLRASVPRVDCPTHGPQVIEIPWAARKLRFTFAYEEHVLRVLESSKSVAAACGLLKSGWGVSDRILKRVAEMSLMQRSSAVRDAEALKSRNRDLAALLNAVEEMALNLARRLHRRSAWLSSQWVEEIHNASNGSINIIVPERQVSAEEFDEIGNPGEPIAAPELSAGLHTVPEGPATGSELIPRLEFLVAPILAVMDASTVEDLQPNAVSPDEASLSGHRSEIGQAA